MPLFLQFLILLENFKYTWVKYRISPLFSWHGYFVETQSFHIFSSDLSETLWKLWASTEFLQLLSISLKKFQCSSLDDNEFADHSQCFKSSLWSAVFPWERSNNNSDFGYINPCNLPSFYMKLTNCGIVVIAILLNVSQI